jgi:hypothetical protein
VWYAWRKLRLLHRKIGFISTSVTSSLNHTYYSTIADLHNLHFTVTHALQSSVSTSRLLATDLNTETITSNHYEVFLPFLVQSPWNLETQLKTLLGCSKPKSKLCYDRRSVGQSASLSWCRAPIWGLQPNFYFRQTFAGLLMWSAISDERTGLPFTVAAGRRHRSHSWVWVPWDSWPYFIVSDLRLPQPGGPGPCIYIPQEQGGPVISPDIGFPFRLFLRQVKVTLRLTVSQAVSLGVEPQIYLLLFDSYGCFSGAPSLTRGRVCLLYMLLALASVVFLGSESLGTRGHSLLSQIWDFPFHRLLRLAGSRWSRATQRSRVI